MKVLQFRTAVMVCAEPANTSIFTDGSFNQMWLDDPALHLPYAHAAGYEDDWRRYITEHDAVHHLIADALDWPWSWALHDGDGNVPVDRAPPRIRDEEHLVQRVQRQLMLDHEDPFGQLQATFGDRLAGFVQAVGHRLDADLGPIARPGLRG